MIIRHSSVIKNCVTQYPIFITLYHQVLFLCYVPKQLMWDLWWTKWPLDGLTSKNFGFLFSSFHQCSTLHLSPRYIILAIDSFINKHPYSILTLYQRLVQQTHQKSCYQGTQCYFTLTRNLTLISSIPLQNDTCFCHSCLVFLCNKCACAVLIQTCLSRIAMHSCRGLNHVRLMSYYASLQPSDKMFFLGYRSGGLVTTEQSEWAQF